MYHLSYNLNFTTKYSSYFIKMALVGFKYEEVNKICFVEEQDMPNVREKSRKIHSFTEWYRCEK